MMPMPILKKSSAKKILTAAVVEKQQASAGTSTSRSRGWDIAAKTAITIGVFLLPLMTGNWTGDHWEIHKTVILLLSVTVAWLCYTIGQLRHPSGGWVWHPLDWIVIALGAATVIGTTTSVNWWTSVAGLQGAYAETLPVMIGLISIYFLSVRLFQTSAERAIIWSALLGGIGLSLLIQLAQFSGLTLLPAKLVSADPLFSTLANSSIQVAVLAAMIGTVGFLLIPQAKERWSRYSLALVVAIGWLSLFFLGQAVGWTIFALGMIVVVLTQARKSTKVSSRLIMIAVVLAAAGLLAQFLKLSTHTGLPSTAETALSQSTSAATAFSAVAKRPVLGTGPNTWYYAFVQYRPLSFNSDARWSGRFLRSGAEWSQLLATQGVVGVGLWVGLLAIAGWEFWRRLRAGYSFSLLAGLFCVGALALAAAFTTWSLVVLLVVWMALSMARANIAMTEKKSIVHRSMVPALGFAVTVIVGVLVWYPAVRIYTSQIYLQIAQARIDKQEASKMLIPPLQQAVHYDIHNVDAGILLANAQAYKFQEDVTAADYTAAQADLTLATTTIRSVVVHNSTNPAAYEAENNMLNSLASYLPNPEVQANKNFIVLQDMEPSNPIQDVGYGQTLLVIRARAAANTTTPPNADAQATLLTKAIHAFNEALRKKPDYLQAKFARADAYVAAGQYQPALDDLNALTVASPDTAMFWAGKGTVLGKMNSIDQAKTAFEQALLITPDDPSTYLAYSQALSDAKKTDDAKAVLNRGITAIPGNTDLTDALKKLTS